MLAADSATNVYTFLYILLGIVGLGGTAGVLGVYKWAKKQGVRDAQLDRVIDVVLNGSNGKTLTDRLDAQDRQLEDIKREAKPNGGQSQRLGDIAKRTEQKVDGLSSKLDQHIGIDETVQSDLKKRVSDIERRSA